MSEKRILLQDMKKESNKLREKNWDIVVLISVLMFNQSMNLVLPPVYFLLYCQRFDLEELPVSNFQKG